MPYWSPDDGIYFAYPSGDVEVTKGSFSLKAELTNQLMLESSFLYEENRHKGGLLEPFPYHPKEKAEASLRYIPVAGLDIETNLSYVGKRFTLTGEELRSFFLTGVRGSKEVLSRLRVWGRLDNLFNSPYRIWEDYPMPGRSFTAGLGVKW